MSFDNLPRPYDPDKHSTYEYMMGKLYGAGRGGWGHIGNTEYDRQQARQNAPQNGGSQPDPHRVRRSGEFSPVAAVIFLAVMGFIVVESQRTDPVRSEPTAGEYAPVVDTPESPQLAPLPLQEEQSAPSPWTPVTADTLPTDTLLTDTLPTDSVPIEAVPFPESVPAGESEIQSPAEPIAADQLGAPISDVSKWRVIDPNLP